MPRNGSGSYSLPESAFVSGTTIASAAVNSNFSDLATALTASIARDGQTTITANLPMAGYRHTGVGNGSARTDYAAMGQVQDSTPLWGGTAGGTANALTITLTPAITSYAAGQTFRFLSSASANTAAATLAVNGLATKDIQTATGAALGAGAIPASSMITVSYDGTAFRLIAAVSLEAGQWKELSRATASASATIEFTGISSAYDLYRVEFYNIVPATNGTDLRMRTSTDGGGSYDAGASDYIAAYWSYYDTPGSGGAGGAASGITLNGTQGISSTATNGGLSGFIEFAAPSAAVKLNVWGVVAVSGNTTTGGAVVSGQRATAADVDAIRFLMAAGNITSGTFVLLGRRK